MGNPSISIIIPVYNGSKYIKQTFDALLGQITDAVEIILVDDGSTDTTLNIIQQHFSSYITTQQLVVHKQPNGGVSTARNFGIAHAKGDYIGFMDADDLALPHYINTVLKAIEQKTDIVEFGFRKFINSNDTFNETKSMYSNTKFGIHEVSQVLNEVYSTARWYPWTRYFQKNLFSGVYFPDGISFCEDLMTIPKLYEKAQSILVLEDAIYGYRTNLNSATFKVDTNSVKNLIDYYNKIPPSLSIRYQYLKVSVAFALLSCQTKSTGNWNLPAHIQSDLYKMRFSWPIYYNVELRKLVVLLYPKLYIKVLILFRYFKNLFGSH
jgi:glycosyltransferase involved in cell wall biosynthesis